MLIAVYFHDIDSILDYSIDWSRWLDTGDQIISSTWAQTGGPVSQPQPPTFVSSLTTFWAGSGTVGAEVTLTNTIHTQSGVVDERSILLRLVEPATLAAPLPATPTLPMPQNVRAIQASTGVSVSWLAPPESVLAVNVYRSTNGGKSFSAVAVLPNDKTGPSYDGDARRFAMFDPTGAPEYVYRVSTSDGVSDSIPAFVLVEPAVNVVTVYGVLVDGFGEALAPRFRQVYATFAGPKTSGPLLAVAGLGVSQLSRLASFDDDGKTWKVRALAGTLLRIRIPSSDLDVTVRVPMRGSFVALDSLPVVPMGGGVRSPAATA